VLAKELVEAHGGTIEWRPDAPGTVFTLAVPSGPGRQAAA
jgi:nitrogen-specific signal transduction histidine kinase